MFEPESFFNFMEKSPTCFHAIANVKEMLLQAGAKELTEDKKFEINKGNTYFVTRNDSSLIAFQIPDVVPEGYHIYAAHSDSPCFKIKPNPEMKAEGTYVMLNTEKYGGMILSTWLDRPLSIAGRVAVLENDSIVTKLVNLNEVICVIPNLAIHMSRDMNKGVEYNPQTDMRPLFGLSKDEKSLDKLLAEKLGIQVADILGRDLYVYAKDPCYLMGANKELIGSPRLDDLECVFAGTEGFLQAMSDEDESNPFIKVLAVFDNEEVGSSTKQGADSTFLTDILDRMEAALDTTVEESKCMRANSFMISADNAHAVHPNHPEKADPTNRPMMNAGIVIKYHGGQKYTTDAYSESYMKLLCKKADVSYQTYANKSDIAGGSTLGNISTTHLSIPTVDIGLAQLAMHSAFETAGLADYLDLCKVAYTFFAV